MEKQNFGGLAVQLALLPVLICTFAAMAVVSFFSICGMILGFYSGVIYIFRVLGSFL